MSRPWWDVRPDRRLRKGHERLPLRQRLTPHQQQVRREHLAWRKDGARELARAMEARR